MAKASLIILGMIIIIAMFFVLEIALTPAEKSDIKTANSLCTAEFEAWGLKFPVGRVGQEVFGKQDECRNVHYMCLLVDYGWIAYAFGGLLFILGLVLSEGRRYSHEEKPTTKHITKYCGECGSGLSGHEKHCPECGEKI